MSSLFPHFVVKYFMAKLKLRELREEKGLAQKELAKEIGVNWRTISNYELGLREPNIDTIEKLCLFFGVTADFLLGIKHV